MMCCWVLGGLLTDVDTLVLMATHSSPNVIPVHSVNNPSKYM